MALVSVCVLGRPYIPNLGAVGVGDGDGPYLFSNFFLFFSFCVLTQRFPTKIWQDQRFPVISKRFERFSKEKAL